MSFTFKLLTFDIWLLTFYFQRISFYFLITYGVCKKRTYCNHMSEKENSLLLTNVHVLYVLEDKKSKKKIRLCVRTWTFPVDTIIFEGVSGSKQNLVGVFYVWNVGLVLKSKVKSWSWSWSSSWTGFWFWKKLCGTTPNLVGIFKTQCITFVIDFSSGILILILILKKKNLKKFCGTKLKISMSRGYKSDSWRKFCKIFKTFSNSCRTV